MCQCKNVMVGSYDNQVELPIPNCMENYRQYRKSNGFSETICIDFCLSEEIKDLWQIGIETTGCCCGHNYLDAYIGVTDKFIPKMLELGYVIHINPNDETRRDSFIPKTKL